jgi:predicted AAA+ superfamily ATPase
MRPFPTIAIPHIDILGGRLTMDVFAADLWEVFMGRAPEEYQDPTIFFRKTYITDGLKNPLGIAEKRLKGKGGDPIIQLQTPFGGGKTHSLIALYHKAKEWGAKTVVIDGTALDPKEITIWEEIERQLTGKVEKLKGKTSHGRENLRKLFDAHQPLLILMDEILEYTTKASGTKVGDSNLASQVLAFVQELTGTVKTLDKSFLILTLPSSILEHYDENAEKLFQQLQKITGRMEKVYTPVHDEEIDQVIRRRLFSSIDEKEARKVIELIYTQLLFTSST